MYFKVITKHLMCSLVDGNRFGSAAPLSDHPDVVTGVIFSLWLDASPLMYKARGSTSAFHCEYDKQKQYSMFSEIVIYPK